MAVQAALAAAAMVAVAVAVALAVVSVADLTGLLVVTAALEVVAEGLVFRRLPMERAGPVA